ncbi:hypothetical protein SDC9_84585 [bioreactor metagenome]|uniref:Uncharacterized protein n=1 Tax=bioreactor metagenome TaxID=1076179 RepID=A0A644ZGZ9_9ZZZZ
MFVSAGNLACPVGITYCDFPQDAQRITELGAAAVDADAAAVPTIGQVHRPDVPLLQQPSDLVFLNLQILAVRSVIRREQCIRHFAAVDFGRIDSVRCHPQRCPHDFFFRIKRKRPLQQFDRMQPFLHRQLWQNLAGKHFLERKNRLFIDRRLDRLDPFAFPFLHFFFQHSISSL